MIELKDIREIGFFQKTHALKGELNALINVDSDYISEGNPLILDIDGIFVPFYAESIRPKSTNSFLIKLDGIDSGEEAKCFVNKYIYAPMSKLAPFLDMEEAEIGDTGLLGYGIIDTATGTDVGLIVNVDDSTENILFVVETDDGDEVFIPATEDFITEIDDNSKIVMMYLPDGLIDLNKKQEKAN